ncbi:MAG: hypothetical protein ACJATN_002153 [Neolewinella sp.]|jgi:hypothetical protein
MGGYYATHARAAFLEEDEGEGEVGKVYLQELFVQVSFLKIYWTSKAYFCA